MIIDNLSYEMLSPDFTGNLATAIMTVPPNTASSENVLEHKGEELAFVLDGKITLHLNEEEYILETGDSVKIPAYLKHKWVNQFEKNAIVLFSVTPPIFNTFKKNRIILTKHGLSFLLNKKETTPHINKILFTVEVYFVFRRKLVIYNLY